VWENPAKGGGAQFGYGAIEAGALATDTKDLADLVRNRPVTVHSCAELRRVQSALPHSSNGVQDFVLTLGEMLLEPRDEHWGNGERETDDCVAGAQHAAYTIIRLPLTVAPVFIAWLEKHFPERKDKVLNAVRRMREGRLNTPEFGARMHGDGPVADQIRQVFRVSCQRAGLDRPITELSTAAFRRILPNQLELTL